MKGHDAAISEVDRDVQEHHPGVEVACLSATGGAYALMVFDASRHVFRTVRIKADSHLTPETLHAVLAEECLGLADLIAAADPASEREVTRTKLAELDAAAVLVPFMLEQPAVQQLRALLVAIVGAA